MQVILKKSIRKLGKIGETIEVANGYGRNYLIPQNLAMRATKENVEQFELAKQEFEKKNQDHISQAKKIASEISGKHVFVITESAADGRLFGSVNAKSLAKEISKLAGTELTYTSISLDKPIKFNGVYNIPVELHSEVNVDVIVVVSRSDSEAADALKEYKETPEKEKKMDDSKKEEELSTITPKEDLDY